MSKVTSKLQVTIPKAIAKAHGIGPGTEIVFESVGEGIRVHRVQEEAVEYGSPEIGIDFRLRLFDEATERQRTREAAQKARLGTAADRGWKREDLYDRGDGGAAWHEPPRLSSRSARSREAGARRAFDA